jgi:hypothetical protein
LASLTSQGGITSQNIRITVQTAGFHGVLFCQVAAVPSRFALIARRKPFLINLSSSGLRNAEHQPDKGRLIATVVAGFGR